MGIAFGTAVTAFRNCCIAQYKGTYNHVKYEDIVGDTPKEFPIQGNRFAQISTDNFSKIPGSPVAYWVSARIPEVYTKYPTLEAIADVRHGLSTGKNEWFVRMWEEVEWNKIDITLTNQKEIDRIRGRYVPYNKGGEFRLWYGNADYVLWYDKFGREKMKSLSGHRHDGRERYFQEGITWSFISSSNFGVRYTPTGFAFDVGGSSMFLDNGKVKYVTGLLCSRLGTFFMSIQNPTLNFQVGNLKNVPLIVENQNKVDNIVNKCINMSKQDWDSFETSWDFQHHPLLRKVSTIAEAFDQWQAECDDRFNQLKANEEELNRIFIDIYGLQDELTPEVEDKDVTVRKADLGRDIRSFISYAVGCMFGRYSPYKEGLFYAGGEWDYNAYEDAAWIAKGKPETLEFYQQTHFMPDEDNIIPICDDEYFADDIVGRFAEFVAEVYGADTLDENLKFIADALGGNGQPKDVIRNYFMNDFYKDHCKIYQKRPIYWLFDSGKKNGFKALIYMHRYQPDTIARIRTDYVHEQQARYRTAIADLEQRIANASTGEKVKLNKRLKALNEQAAEIHAYEEKIHHLADQMISIDLDDGVKKNYEIFKDVLAKIK